jgi:hypothetical protein
MTVMHLFVYAYLEKRFGFSGLRDLAGVCCTLKSNGCTIYSIFRSQSSSCYGDSGSGNRLTFESTISCTFTVYKNQEKLSAQEIRERGGGYSGRKNRGQYESINPYPGGFVANMTSKTQNCCEKFIIYKKIEKKL